VGFFFLSFFLILVTGKLNVSTQHNKRLPKNKNKRLPKINKENHSSITEEAMLKCGENPPESTSTSARPQNITFSDVTCKKSDSENEFDDEMIADGKLYE